jgi:hypothetical protein
VIEAVIAQVAVLPMGIAQVSSAAFVTPKADGHKPMPLTLEDQKRLDYQQ